MSIALMILLGLLGVISFIILAARDEIKTPISWMVMCLSVLSAGASVTIVDSLLTLFISLSFVWMLINNSRLLTHRRTASNRLLVVRKGWLTFLLIVAVLALANVIVDNQAAVVILSALSLISAILTLTFAMYHAFVYSTGNVESLSESSEPTLTLAYPARNETHALEDTLKKAVASDYEKLEIIVIDDCSQDKTPQIIRDFAHDGIRFIEGANPSDTWLGKNAAYRTLSEEASGDYLLFSGVDVRLSSQAVGRLVSYAKRKNLSMVSVMPQRVNFDFMANFLQTTRYYFQFVLPWEILPVSPVLSSLWLIKRDTLSDLGGFEAVPAKVVPERYFANALSTEGKYHFVVSDTNLGVTTRKKTSSQLETATRTLYPMLDENPMLAFLSSLSLLVLLVTPFIVTVLIVLGLDVITYDFAIISSVLFTVSNLIVYTRFNASSWFIGLFNFPFIVILEAIMIQWSMVKYEFSTIMWKDRNICIPVLNPPLKRQRDKPI